MAKATYFKSQNKNSSSSSSLESNFIVHNCVYNEKNTDDGIAAGGKRIADEIIDTLQKYLQSNYIHFQSKVTDITLSFLGKFIRFIIDHYGITISHIV